jgi:hypothetical protein
MKFFYGVEEKKIDVTDIVMEKCKVDDTIYIPKLDYVRDNLFTDPLFGVNKFVFIETDEKKTVLDEGTDLYIDLNDINAKPSTFSSEIDPSLLVNGLYKPKLCFACICKNEEHVILDLLNSVYKHIDYWVICDTGSTDKTCELITEFFKEKNIPGELFHDDWVGMGPNKTLMFERCYKKMDYVLHIDADDMLAGNFDFQITEHKSSFYMNCKSGSLNYKCTLLYNSNLHWKICGIAHTTCKYLDKNVTLQIGDLSDRDYWIQIRTNGARSLDPNKYLNDALKIKNQFFETLYDDPDGLNYRSVFYTAQSYYDQGMYKEAVQWYTLYTKLKNTWIEEFYEANKRLSELFMKLKQPLRKIIDQIDKTSAILPDRAEHLVTFGKYLNNLHENELAYKYLLQAKAKDFSVVLKKYSLFVSPYAYGKYINDELAVACYHTKRYTEGIVYLEAVIDDKDFAGDRDRLMANLNFLRNGLSK